MARRQVVTMKEMQLPALPRIRGHLRPVLSTSAMQSPCATRAKMLEMAW